LLWLPCAADADIIFLTCGFFFLSIFLFFSRLISAVACHRLDVCHTANLGCRSETCCTRLAENTRRKKVAKNSPSLHHCTTLSAMSSQRIDTRKNFLNSNTSSFPHNMANFGPLTAEIGSGVWSTPANFNGFRILVALLHGTLVVGISQTLRR